MLLLSIPHTHRLFTLLSGLLLSFHRKVFFTDYGQIPKVERCDMDGQNRTKLVDSKIVFPHGITLDLVSRLVYWADAYLDYIEVVDYEGKNRHTIIQGLLVRRPAALKHTALLLSSIMGNSIIIISLRLTATVLVINNDPETRHMQLPLHL